MNGYSSKEGTAVAEQSQEIRDVIISWLKDAYAMERGMEGTLTKATNESDLLAETRAGAKLHLEQTKHHAEEVRSVLQSLGEDTSALKTSMGVVGQLTKGVFTAFAGDQHIKDILDAYMMEHFEIACYTALEVAADEAGLIPVAEMCRRIIPEEELMAQTLFDLLPVEVTSHLSKRAHEASA
jgi:ferritin-like metal-binding protein YciE